MLRRQRGHSVVHLASDGLVATAATSSTTERRSTATKLA